MSSGNIQELPAQSATSKQPDGRRRRWPLILGSIVAVLGGLLIGLWLALPSIVAAILRSELGAAEKELKREIEFDHVELHGLSGIDLHGVVIHDMEGEGVFLEAERLEVRLSDSPLFGADAFSQARLAHFALR